MLSLLKFNAVYLHFVQYSFPNNEDLYYFLHLNKNPDKPMITHVFFVGMLGMSLSNGASP